MTSNDPDDARLERVGPLPCLAPDPERAGRTRARCRAQLERRRRRSTHMVSTVGFARRALTPVVVGGFCVFFVLYVSALVTTTLRLQGALR